MTNATLLGLATTLYLAGAAAALALGRDRRRSGRAATLFAGLAGAALWVAAIRVFTGGPEPDAVVATLPGLGASFAVRVDALSALFLAIIATIGFLTTLFSVEYMRSYPRDTVARYYPLLLLLLTGITGVVVSADFVFFLVAWELMTLTSFFLVGFERESRPAQRAALKYFVVNQGAALGMLAAGLILWSRTGSFHFDALRDGMSALVATQPALAHLVLFLFFLGFATKAGILPMGDWLPDAYPSAPSGATAAFGGTMTKLGVYGILRVFLGFLPLSPAAQVWGVIIALAGVASLFVGTLTALRQDDVKRLMSFHVIGQVGYMFLGIGMGLYFLESHPVLAAIGILGGVFHMLNHSLYKSCLFLGAGAVLHRTGSRSLTAVGGLQRVMPVTAACALGAALAIAGVPPFNGFASKWLIYATAILGGRSFPLFAVLGIVAMFISLVTLASFLKYLGGAFFGAVPPAMAERGDPPREVPGSMMIPQIVLASACVVFGLVPRWPLELVSRAVAGLRPDMNFHPLAALSADGLGLRIAEEAGGGAARSGAWSPLPIALALVALACFAYYALQRAGGAARREVPVWTCGEDVAGHAGTYPATSFYLPFKHAFQGIYPAAQLRAPRFPRRLRAAFDLDRWLYVPLGRAVEKGARQTSRTHVGIPQVYLIWIVAGAILVIAIMLAFAREGWMRP